jgi:hypothetical protein
MGQSFPLAVSRGSGSPPPGFYSHDGANCDGIPAIRGMVTPREPWGGRGQSEARGHSAPRAVAWSLRAVAWSPDHARAVAWSPDHAPRCGMVSRPCHSADRRSPCFPWPRCASFPKGQAEREVVEPVARPRRNRAPALCRAPGSASELGHGAVSLLKRNQCVLLVPKLRLGGEREKRLRQTLRRMEVLQGVRTGIGRRSVPRSTVAWSCISCKMVSRIARNAAANCGSN